MEQQGTSGSEGERNSSSSGRGGGGDLSPSKKKRKQVHGILASGKRKERPKRVGGIVWDEDNLIFNESQKSATMKIDEPPTPYNRDYDSAEEADDEYGSNSESEEAASDRRAKGKRASAAAPAAAAAPTTDTPATPSTTDTPSTATTTATTTTTASSTATSAATQPPHHLPPVSPRTSSGQDHTEHSAALRSALKRIPQDEGARPRPRFFSSSEDDDAGAAEVDAGANPQETGEFKKKRSQHYNEWQKLQEFRKKQSPPASSSSTPGADAEEEEEEEEEP